MIIGIDYSSARCTVATVEDDAPSTISDGFAREVSGTPRTVAFLPGIALVGYPAVTLGESDRAASLVNLYEDDLGRETPVFTSAAGEDWYAEGIAGLVLRKLRCDAEAKTSARVTGCVIAVDRALDRSGRARLIAAAELAGMPAMALIDREAAMAVHHIHARGSAEEVMAVCDLRESSLAVSVLKYRDGEPCVASSQAIDFGMALIRRHITERILEQFDKGGLRLPRDRRLELQLHGIADRLARQLARSDLSWMRALVCLTGHPAEVYLPRAIIQDVTPKHSASLVQALSMCLDEAGCRPKELAAVLLAGDALCFSEWVQSLGSLAPAAACHRVLDGEAAQGAALHAERMWHQGGSPLSAWAFRTTSCALGLWTVEAASGQPRVETIVAAGTPLPVERTRSFYVSHPTQDLVYLDLVDCCAGHHPIRQARLEFPVSTPSVGPAIHVAVNVGGDGTLEIRAMAEGSSDRSHERRIQIGERRCARLTEQLRLVHSVAVNEC